MTDRHMGNFRKTAAVAAGGAYFLFNAYIYKSGRLQFSDALLIDIPVTIVAVIVVGLLWPKVARS
jgi:hypothetical protein